MQCGFRDPNGHHTTTTTWICLALFRLHAPKTMLLPFTNAPYRHPQYLGWLIIMYVLRYYNIAPHRMMPAGCNKNRAAQMFFQYLWLVCWLGDNWELNWITDAFFARQKWVIIHILLSCSMMLQNTNLIFMWGINLVFWPI